MARSLKGKPVADAVGADIEARVQALREKKVHPKLAVIRVGEDPADIAYEATVTKRAEALGIAIDTTHLQGNVSRLALSAIIEGINVDRKIHGCLLFRPLPKGLDELKMCNMIAPEKDVDGVGAQSLAGVFMDLEEGFAPATAEACIALLDHYGIDIKAKHIAIVGRSLVVGKPASMLMLRRDATVTLCHSKTEDLRTIMRAADIVVCAVGRAREFGAECFREGQIVLDVGTNTDENGIFCGDVDDAAVEPIVSALTPVPGGIGSVTASILLRHVVEAAERASSSR